MKISSNISIKLIIRLAFFVAIVAGAVIFDCSRDETLVAMETEQEPVSNHTDNISFYVSPVKTQNFESESKLIPKRISNQSQFKHLRKMHNIKTYHILKAESLDSYSALVSFHFLQFRECIYTSPDDYYITLG